ncbi:MAG: helix-turn-helix domain-containing protein [Planctomycetota bacterium]
MNRSLPPTASDAGPLTPAESPLEQVFSIPFQHLWSTNFSGETTAESTSPTGLARFVGDQPNFLLQYFADQPSAMNRQIDAELATWPLVLYGAPGTGKTSLAMAILARLSDDTNLSNASDKPLFLSAPDFDRRYRLALETNSIDDFQRSFLMASGVVIDDLHKLTNKPGAQRQLASILDLLPEKNRPFLITVDRSPTNHDGLLPRLCSRLTAGLCLPLQPPGVLARKQIIIDFADRYQINLTDDAVDQMVDQMIVTVPKIHQFFNQLKLAIHSDPNFDPTVAIDTKQLLQLQQRSPEDIETMARLVITSVAKEFHLKPTELKSDRRNQTVVLARGVAIYLLRTMLPLSFQKIGSYFGNRDHSTILHAHRKLEKLICEPSPDAIATAKIVDHLNQHLTEQFANRFSFV